MARAKHLDWLVIVATPLEGALVQRSLRACRASVVAGVTCLRGWWPHAAGSRLQVALIAGGLGQANAAAAAAVGLAQLRPAAVACIGVAGGYAADRWQPGQVAQGQVFGLGDEGVVDAQGWHDLSAIGIPLQPRPASRARAAFNRIWAPLVSIPAARGRGPATPGPFPAGILTVAACSGSAARARAMRRRAQTLVATPATATQSRLPWVEDMETAAVALACARAATPLLALRGISNTAGDRDKSRWQIRAAAEAAQAAAWRAITGLPWSATAVPPTRSARGATA